MKLEQQFVVRFSVLVVASNGVLYGDVMYLERFLTFQSTKAWKKGDSEERERSVFRFQSVVIMFKW